MSAAAASRQTGRQTGALLGAAIVVLAGLTLWPWLRWAVQAPDQAPASANAAPLAPPALAPAEQFREIAERPLFAPDRRPSATARPAAAPLGLRLEGIIAIGGVKRAIIKQADGRSARVGEGDTLGEWTVRRIESDRVVLGGAERELELVPARRPPTPPTR
jgi:general secretion pathway protein N